MSLQQMSGVGPVLLRITPFFSKRNSSHKNGSHQVYLLSSFPNTHCFMMLMFTVSARGNALQVT